MVSRRAELQDLEPRYLKGKVVLVRVDYNVPIAAANNHSNSKEHHTWIVTDDTKIRASLPTINYLSQAGKDTLCVMNVSRRN